jgi:hypothetical protein
MNVGADAAADATYSGDDDVADILFPAGEVTETGSPAVGAIPFTRRVERYPATPPCRPIRQPPLESDSGTDPEA